MPDTGSGIKGLVKAGQGRSRQQNDRSRGRVFGVLSGGATSTNEGNPHHSDSANGDFDTTMVWLLPDLHLPGFLWFNAMDHAGRASAKIHAVHAMRDASEPAAVIPTPSWCGNHQEGSSEDSCGSTPWFRPEPWQRGFASRDGIAHTGIPAAVIPTPGWRGACRPMQLRQWHWRRLWMWSVRPVSSSPVHAAGCRPLRHRSGGSPWLCGSG